MHKENDSSIKRIATAFDEPRSSVGRWAKPLSDEKTVAKRKSCPVSDDLELRKLIRSICQQEYYHSHGYRWVKAALRRFHNINVNRKTVYRIMREDGLARPKKRYKPKRPWRIGKMRPSKLNEGWQIDMTSFVISNLTTLYLIVVIDCCSREIVGWALDRRCRASEWVSALRIALESKGLSSKEMCQGLTLRSDNGAQPCSKEFVKYLAKTGVQGEYTGYNSPNENAFVERVIRTIKEEEIWPSWYDSFAEAHQAVDKYFSFYNNERMHSALDYRTPREAAEKMSPNAA